jgi:hypothetical protein
MMIRTATLSLLLVVCALVAVGCAGESKEAIALEAAERWAERAVG